MLDHAGQLGFIEMQAIEMSLRSTDTMLLVMPFYHIGAKCNYLMTLVRRRERHSASFLRHSRHIGGHPAP